MVRSGGNWENFGLSEGKLSLAALWAYGRCTRVRWENHRDNPEAPILRGWREGGKLGGAESSKNGSCSLADKGCFEISPD